MTNRIDVLTAVVSHLRTAGEPYLDDPVSQVTQKNPESTEHDASIVYRADSRYESFNNASSKPPSRFKYNDAGEKVDEAYPHWVRLRFDIQTDSVDLMEKEQMLAAIVNVFRPYTDWKDYDDFVPDCNHIELNGTTATDDTSTQPVMRSDVFSLRILYTEHIWRFGSQDTTGTPIREIRQDFSDPEDDRSESEYPEPTTYVTDGSNSTDSQMWVRDD